MMSRFSLVLLAMLLLSAPVRGVGASAEPSTESLGEKQIQDVFVKMHDALKDMRSVRLAFVQTRHLAVFSDTLVTSGVCAFVRPDKLRWDMLEPMKTSMIYDGRDAARYEWRDGAWARTGGNENREIIAEVLGRMARWMRGDFDEASRVHEIEVRRDGARLTMRMRPKSDEMREMISAIELLIAESDWSVRRVTICEPGGDKTVIDFTAADINGTFPDRAFDLQNPSGPLRVPSGTREP